MTSFFILFYFWNLMENELFEKIKICLKIEYI